MQVANTAPSSEHASVAFGSLDVNVNAALVWFVGVAGDDVIEGVGVVTIVHG